jgi:predicted RNase H-like HicB family nuclease
LSSGRIFVYPGGGDEMKFRIVVEYDPETKSYAAYCPELPGCCSAGDTEEEALENAKEALSLYLEPAPLKLKPDEKLYEVKVAA